MCQVLEMLVSCAAGNQTISDPSRDVNNTNIRWTNFVMFGMGPKIRRRAILSKSEKLVRVVFVTVYQPHPTWCTRFFFYSPQNHWSTIISQDFHLATAQEAATHRGLATHSMVQQCTQKQEATWHGWTGHGLPRMRGESSIGSVGARAPPTCARVPPTCARSMEFLKLLL